MQHRAVFLAVPAAIIAADQASKAWIRVSLPAPGVGNPEKWVVIPKLFNIVSVRNKGAAWGLFAESDYRLAFFTTVTLAAFVLIGSYAKSLRPEDGWVAFSLATVLGGALGNFIDRLLYGEVTDFLQFFASGSFGVWCIETFGTRYFPSFNIADVAISCGVFAFLLLSLDPRAAQNKSRAMPQENKPPLPPASENGEDEISLLEASSGTEGQVDS